MEWILRRFKEPSTWRGLTILLTMAGLKLTPEQSDAVILAGISVVGLIEVFRKEKPKAEDPPPLPWLQDIPPQPNRKDSL